MKLIVGLGNPGKDYQYTRHNTGFMVLEAYAKYHNVLIDKKKFNGLYGEFFLDGEKVVLLEPLSYMNLSGEVVSKFVSYFQLDPKNDLLIICDDLDLPFLAYRLRKKGSSGGHNGLKNIELHLKTNEYKRMRIGIANNKNVDTKDYVLGSFSKENLTAFTDFFAISNAILDDFIQLDFERLMSKYNKKESL